MAEPLLRVRDLRTYFYTENGIARSVDGVTFEIAAGETVGLVGESGCGKSVTALSLLRLVRPPGRIEKGSEISFDGKNLVTLDEKSMREIRGARMSMVSRRLLTNRSQCYRITIREASRAELRVARMSEEERREKDRLRARRNREKALRWRQMNPDYHRVHAAEWQKRRAAEKASGIRKRRKDAGRRRPA